MKRGHRFLAYSLGAVASASAAGRLLVRRDARRPDPDARELLGSARGTPRWIRGPRGSELYVEEFPGAGPHGGTVIFTHGWCLTEAVWHFQKIDLAGNGFSMLTWDLPGHGHSRPVPHGRLTLDLAAAALERVIEEAGGDVVLVGHSLGGVITLAHVARAAPEVRRRVRGMVLISTPLMHFARSVAGRWPGASVEARALGTMVRVLVESDLIDRLLVKDVGKQEVTRLSYRIIRQGFGRDASPSQVRFLRDVIASVPPSVRQDTLRVMTGYDMTPHLATLDVPALVVVGERDRLVNPEESKLLASALPRSRLLVLPDTGHAAFLEARVELGRELRRFVERRLGRPGAGAGSA
ncbi:MAG: alpha/beta hydrolase [Actinomycetota bacterium]|nr:alpha/beta hydrolase [Actinomycetota bacterium]